MRPQAPLSCVHFCASAASHDTRDAVGASVGGADAAEGGVVRLFSGAVDGTIQLWQLEAAAGAGLPLRCIPSRLLAPGLGPVYAISSLVVAPPPPQARPPGAAAGEPAAQQTATTHLVAGLGQRVVALATGGGAAGGRAWRLRCEARHKQQVTAVLCTPECWLSASVDGEVLHAPYEPPPAPAAATSAPASATGASAASSSTVATTKLWLPPPAIPKRQKDGGKEKKENLAPTTPMPYGLALSPCGARVIVLQRCLTRGSTRALELDHFRLLGCLCAPPAELLSPARLLLAAAPGGVRSWRPVGAPVSVLGSTALQLAPTPRVAAIAALEAAVVAQIEAAASADAAPEAALDALRGAQLLRAIVASSEVHASRPTMPRHKDEIDENSDDDELKNHLAKKGNAAVPSGLRDDDAMMDDDFDDDVEGGDDANDDDDDDDDDDDGSEEEAEAVVTPEEAAKAAAALHAAAERAGRALLGAQARALLGATGGTPQRGGPSRETALAAADWILALCLWCTEQAAGEATAASSSAASDGAAAAAVTMTTGLRLGREEAGDLELARGAYARLGCAEGGAAVAALQQLRRDRASGGASVVHVPRREGCPICAVPLEVTPSVELARCERGHTSHRCWLNLRPLPINAWQCETCGAARRAASADAHGPLHVLAPPGVCGMCGSMCRDICTAFGFTL